MSFYTTQLRFPLEQCLRDQGVSNEESNWPLFWKRCGLDSYPIFREDYRDELNTMIVRRFYFREIGFETFEQFAFMMRRTMREIMPYYNLMYKALEQMENPFWDRNLWHDEVWDIDTDRNTTDNIDSTETTDRDVTTDNSHTGTSNTTDSNENVFNDTPMNSLNSGDVKSMRYATNVTFDEGDTSTSDTSTDRGTTAEDTSRKHTAKNVNVMDNDEDGSRNWHDYGYTKSPLELFLKLMNKRVNIDEQVLNDLETLFIGLWQ